MARRRGFTLVELMLVGMLTLLVSLGTFALAYRAWRSQEEILIQNEVARQARAAADAAADVLRNMPWGPTNQSNVHAVTGAANSNSVLGLLNTGTDMDFRMNVQSGKLILVDELGAQQASASNITRFKVNFIVRTPTAGGGVQETELTDFANRAVPVSPDARYPYVVGANISVTASRTSSDQMVFTSTATSTVKIRNNFYLIAP
jgi:type II secretory pathway pseudopilin PulG